MNALSTLHNRRTRACNTCRKQKRRCNRKGDACETCTRLKRDCIWSSSLLRSSAYYRGLRNQEHRTSHENRESFGQYGEEVKDQRPGPKVSRSDKEDRAAQTLTLHRDSINEKSAVASHKSLGDLTYDEVRRCGEIYFQDWAPLFPTLTEIEFQTAVNAVFHTDDPTSRDIHVTQIYLVVEIAGISPKGHGLEQSTGAPRWQGVLDRHYLEPSIQILQCFALSLLCYTKRRDYTRLCLYMDRAIGLYKDLFLRKNHEDENYPRVALESHKGISWTLFTLDCFSAAAINRPMQLKYQDIESTSPHEAECPHDKASTALYLLRAAQILAQVLVAECPVSRDSRKSFSQRMEYLKSKLDDWYGRLPDRLQLDKDMKSSYPALMTITYYYILAHIHKLALHFGVKDEHLRNLTSFKTSCTNIIDLVGRLEKTSLNFSLCLNRKDLVSVCELGKSSTIVPPNAL
ncbi:uncharacterized protein FFNC_15385 [Fusarium fujikuroi]|nr:uncharacterized protein FFNC_15385 [Fusarium fujikuroi]